jgi:hypothetical protein
VNAATINGMKYSNEYTQSVAIAAPPIAGECPIPPAIQMIGPPHIATELPTPVNDANAPPTAPAIMNEGIQIFGFEAANGIDPSVIPKNPIIEADVAAAFSFSSMWNPKNLPNNNTHSITIGGIETAVAAIPFSAGKYPDVPGVPRNATAIIIAILLTGPPRSKQIIVPINIPARNNKWLSTNIWIKSLSPNPIPYNGKYPTNAKNTQGKIVNVNGMISNGSIVWNA